MTLDFNRFCSRSVSLVLEDRRLLFTQEIFNFSINYCQRRGCEVEVEELNKTNVTSSKMLTNTGIVKGLARIVSDSLPVFRLLKFESGVERVQRVPVTGTKADRLQTNRSVRGISTGT